MMKLLTLYKNHKASIGYWSIGRASNVIHIYYATTLSGARQHRTETVDRGKQARSLKDQVMARMKSRVRKQLDKGYVRTLAEAKLPPTNTLNLQQPMLAQPIGRRLPRNYFIQDKLDGHRCLVTKANNELIAYTRQGKRIHTIPHILNEIEIHEGYTLDGELYAHGESLQTIASWVKREQPSTKSLTYCVYDTIMSAPFADRLAHLQTLDMFSVPTQSVNLVKTELVEHDRVTLVELSEQAVERGYEGLIVRCPRTPYEPGRRSPSLLKVKPVQDAEFKVIDVVSSVDNWGVLVCELSGDKTFNTPAPGTLVEKAEVLRNKASYLGRLVTVEYSHLTKDGIPFHPVAKRWLVTI